MSPPIRSTAREMSAAVRVVVPLNSRCSRKWLTPESSAGSSREPTEIHAPIATERAPGTRSMAIVSPLSRQVIDSCMDDSRSGRLRTAWSRRTARSGSAVAAPSAVTAAAATVPAATGVALPAAFTRAEIADLIAQLLVEAVLERHVDDLAVAATRRVVVTDRGQADLPLVVDLVHADLELLAEREDVLDGVDPPSPAELGDVHQPVTPGEDVDERAELRDVHDAARVQGPELGLGRVDDGEDRRLRLLHPPRLDGADRDDALCTVVIDADVGAGLGLDGVDHLALRADHLADLVDRDRDGGDLRRGGRHLGA